SYYAQVRQEKNIYPVAMEINPFSLLEIVDKVYVCSSQLGVEALMAGKEVHVYGLPFYAGWGLTRDQIKCPRRTRTRTLEELVYIAYILYSHYVIPGRDTSCEIEDAVDYLLELRREYFEKFKICHER
ncbi:MAG: hypothetical protein LBK71_11060, partial [Verrucomicrobiales bacterium]|nr:hypothetical protein [Verrucomicrobiales bacterium]